MRRTVVWAAVLIAEAAALSGQTAPSVIGPLKMPEPVTFDAGPFGKLGVSGVLSGFGMVQGNRFPSDATAQADVSNAQIFLQKTDGWWQFYVQAGAYNFVQIGVPFLSTADTVQDFYGPLPIAYLKVVPAKNTSILVGALPTLMGAESAFTFENMDVERGLLWTQENTVNRGIQVNQTVGKVSASLSWNDGYYSNRFSWLSGSLTYASGPHSLVFSGMGNLSQTAFQTIATPVQNNSTMYAVMYTYTKGPWIVQPYFQFSDLPRNPRIGIARDTGTRSGALLLSHAFQHGFSLAGRWEYIAANGSVNLLYGPGSAATSFTVTPAYQSGGFFMRGDLSWVHAVDYTPGAGFGPGGAKANQPRVVGEIGFLFGRGVI